MNFCRATSLGMCIPLLLCIHFKHQNKAIQVGELLLFISVPKQTLFVLTSSLGAVLKVCCLSVYSEQTKNN